MYQRAASGEQQPVLREPQQSGQEGEAHHVFTAFSKPEPRCPR